MRSAIARREPSTATLAAMLIVSACGKHEDKPAPAPAPPPTAPSAATPPPPPAPPTPHDAGASAASKALAQRCVLGGDPIADDCSVGNEGIAFDHGGRLYVVAAKDIRRYKKTGTGPCSFEPDGAAIPLPPENKRAQTVGKGSIYMRSGGPAWHLATAGDAVYAIDFLAGMFRIDRGKAEPACTNEFGYDSVAALGKRLVIARKGLEVLALSGGGRCRATSAKIDDKAHGKVFAVHDHLYAGFVDITRYDGTKKVPLGDSVHACSVTGIAACGAGTCIADNNCMKLVELAADGSVKTTFESDALFERRPYSLATAIEHEGDMYLLAKYRDKNTCETAVYQVPASAL
jgi:hypothetical protein